MTLVGSFLLANGRGICAVSADQSKRKGELDAQEKGKQGLKKGQNTI